MAEHDYHGHVQAYCDITQKNYEYSEGTMLLNTQKEYRWLIDMTHGQIQKSILDSLLPHSISILSIT